MSPLLTIIGTIALVGGSVGFFAMPYGLSAGIRSMMHLGETGMIFSKYMKPSEGLSCTYHLYAIKNPKEVLKGKKPSFVVKGPYRFKTRESKGSIKFSKQGERVSFQVSKLVVPLKAESADMDEKMWLVNPVVLTIARVTKRVVIDRLPFRSLAEPVVLNGLQIALDSFNEHPIVKTTPRRMLIGRPVRMFDTLTSLGARYNFVVPRRIFGVVTGSNETLEVWTGVGQTKDKFAEVAKYKDKNELDIWHEDRCNKITGTNGELYKPLPEKGKPIFIFVGSLCRSVKLDPVANGQPIKTESGVDMLEYEFSRRLFKGSIAMPSNECFCDNSRSYDCRYDGLMPMGPCLSGAPLYLCQGNFKDVDPRIRDLVDWQSLLYLNSSKQGLVRMPEKLMVRLDPLTGFPLDIELTMMALFKMLRNDKIRMLANIQPLTYMPLFAMTGTFKAPSEMLGPVTALQKVDEYQSVAMIGTAMSGLGLLLVGSLFG